jgi:ABC-type uncharacterized transport system substrate-binding protein
MNLRRLLIVFASILATLGVADVASAHPHVWVKASAALVFDGEGKVIAIRHAWDFDEAYSAFAVQGLDHDKDGKVSRGEMAELAKVNTESLLEFDYFTRIKLDGKKQAFGAPTDYWLDYDKGILTLHFTLPLKSPKSARAVGLEIYDPTFFVSFAFADGNEPVTATRAGCAVAVTRAKGLDVQAGQSLGESFFSSLSNTSEFGAQFSNKAVISCP